MVTSLKFQAHPVHTVLGGFLLYPRAVAVEVLRNFRDFMEAAPDELTAYAALLHGPDGTPLVGIIPCYCGEVAEGERILKPLRTFGKPVLDTIQPMPFPAMQGLLDASFPDGNQNYWKSTLQGDLSDEAIALIVEHGNRMASPLSFVVLERYGGAAGGFPIMPRPIPTAICRGTSCFSRNGPRPRGAQYTVTGLGAEKRSFGPFQRTRIFFPRSTWKPTTLSILPSVPICHV